MNRLALSHCEVQLPLCCVRCSPLLDSVCLSAAMLRASLSQSSSLAPFSRLLGLSVCCYAACVALPILLSLHSLTLPACLSVCPWHSRAHEHILETSCVANNSFAVIHSVSLSNWGIFFTILTAQLTKFAQLLTWAAVYYIYIRVYTYVYGLSVMQISCCRINDFV